MSDKPNFDGRKYHLSTEGYYFMYRLDKYNPLALRADLFKNGVGDAVDGIKVCYPDYGVDLTHSDVINAFEARLSMKP